MTLHTLAAPVVFIYIIEQTGEENSQLFIICECFDLESTQGRETLHWPGLQHSSLRRVVLKI